MSHTEGNYRSVLKLVNNLIRILTKAKVDGVSTCRFWSAQILSGLSKNTDACGPSESSKSRMPEDKAQEQRFCEIPQAVLRPLLGPVRLCS